MITVGWRCIRMLFKTMRMRETFLLMMTGQSSTHQDLKCRSKIELFVFRNALSLYLSLYHYFQIKCYLLCKSLPCDRTNALLNDECLVNESLCGNSNLSQTCRHFCGNRPRSASAYFNSSNDRVNASGSHLTKLS